MYHVTKPMVENTKKKNKIEEEVKEEENDDEEHCGILISKSLTQ